MDLSTAVIEVPDETVLTETETAQVTAEALRPDDTPDTFTLDGRIFPVKLHPMKTERQIVKLIGPLFVKISSLGGDDVAGMMDLADETFDAIPKAIELITEGILTADVVESKFSITELIPIARAQLAKYGLQDKLGKLSGLSGR